MARPANAAKFTIAELQRIISDKKIELDKLYRQRKVAQKKLAIIDRQIFKVDGGSSSSGNGHRPSGFTSSGRAQKNEHNLIDTIESILAHAGKAMKVPDITEKVLASGYRSGSSNFRGIVNQTLIKDKRFANVDRGVYELKKPGESKKHAAAKSE